MYSYILYCAAWFDCGSLILFLWNVCNYCNQQRSPKHHYWIWLYQLRLRIRTHTCRHSWAPATLWRSWPSFNTRCWPCCAYVIPLKSNKLNYFHYYYVSALCRRLSKLNFVCPAPWWLLQWAFISHCWSAAVRVAFVGQSAALLTNICNTSNSSRPFCGYGHWLLLAIKLHYGRQSLSLLLFSLLLLAACCYCSCAM